MAPRRPTTTIGKTSGCSLTIWTSASVLVSRDFLNSERKMRRVDPDRRRGRVYRLTCRLSVTRLGGWFSRHVGWKLDRHLLRISRGRYSTAWPLAAGLLETRGARSGRPRRNGVLYFHDGNRVTIAASLRGAPHHPAWYHNLCADPDVYFGGLPFRAEVVEEEAERERLWALADRVYPPYAEFRKTARAGGREIPIVQLLPR